MDHYKIEGRLNGSEGGSLEIDRERGLVRVRPKHERREYCLTLLTVAEMVISRVVKTELAEKGVKIPMRRS